MVTVLRRLLSLALIAGLMLINVQAAELHVHAIADHVDQAHHHGPALHRHDVVDHHSSDAVQIVGVDAADTVVHVSLIVTAAPSARPLDAGCEQAPLVDWGGVPSMIDDARIVARAHGPPSHAQPSLRAPPALLSL